MKWKAPLTEAVFLKRYKRFFADVVIDGKDEVAHVPNTGSLRSCQESGRTCLVSRSDDPKRKLKYTLEAIQNSEGTWIGVNTQMPNQLVKENFYSSPYLHWQEFDVLTSEVKINSETRLDFCLTREQKKHFIEVKNVTLKNGDYAEFPDAVSTRGQKHLLELMNLVKQGHSAELLFTVQRSDCKFFRVADDIDPAYGQLLREAQQKGVIISAYCVELDHNNIKLTDRKLPIRLDLQ